MVLEALGDDDREELKQAIANEQAEAAMVDVIKEYKRAHLQTSMEIKGLYDSLLTVGFDQTQAMLLTIAQVQNSGSGSQ